MVLRDEWVDLLTIKELVDHKSLKIMQRYAHASSKPKRQQIEKLAVAFHHEGNNLAHGTHVVQLKGAINE
jgi:hypothetical protein